MSNRLVKKITVKELTGGAAGIRKAIQEVEDGESVDLGVVVGKCSGAKRGKHSLPDGSASEYVRLLGQFRGIPSIGQHKGATFIAGQAILPDVANAPIMDALVSAGAVSAESEDEAAEADREDATEVEGVVLEFAMKLTAARDDSSSTGYKFGAEPLTAIKEEEGMERLLSLGRESMPALSGPEAPASKAGSRAKK